MTDKIEVQNVNVLDHVTRVDAAKYHAMKDAMMKVMSANGMTAKDIKEAAIPHLPDDLFLAGATSGWWQKTVQLDLEAKGVIERHQTKPLTFSLN